MACGQKIAWYDNIPVFSWILLMGRCRHCRSRISAQYPLVEFFTGIGFFILALSGASILELFFGGICVSLLLAIAVYDARHTIIPNSWAYLFAGSALCYSFSYSHLAWVEQPFFWIISGPVAALPLFLLWGVSRGKWMGLGDAKLALGIGWLLGPVLGVFAVFFAFLIGALFSVCILMPLPHIRNLFRKILSLFGQGIASTSAQKSYTMKSEVPFGPFLIAGCLFVWFSILYGVNPLFIL